MQAIKNIGQKWESFRLNQAFKKCEPLGSSPNILVTDTISGLPALKLPHISGLYWDRKVPDELIDLSNHITDEEAKLITRSDTDLTSYNIFPEIADANYFSNHLFGSSDKYKELSKDMVLLLNALKKNFNDAKRYTGWFHRCNPNDGLYDKYHVDMENLVRCFVTYSGNRSTRIITDILSECDYGELTLTSNYLDVEYIEDNYSTIETEIGKVFFSKGHLTCAHNNIQSPVHSGAGIEDTYKRLFSGITAEYFSPSCA